MRISSNFDSGAIEVVSLADPENIRLRLRPDNAAEFRQWFHYRVQGAAGQHLVMRFENAAEAAYPGGWPGYRALASYDRQNWFRVAATRYEDGQLIVEHSPERNSVYYAYFEPYSHERHLDLLGRVEMSPFAEVRNLGASVEGRDIDVVVVGRPRPDKQPVWITARQHPGETMASWFIEGLLERLLDGADPVSRRVRELATLYVVPNMNPDGAIRGNLRTNAAGANLNREWQSPSRARSPRCCWCATRWSAPGCRCFSTSTVTRSCPTFSSRRPRRCPASARRRWRQSKLIAAFKQASPDVQTEHGYQAGRFGEEMLSLASKWVAHRFGCVALTLEMPFKDNANLPDGVSGWSAARSRILGSAALVAVLAHLSEGLSRTD